MKIKRNDNVIIIAGKNKSKHGKIIQVFPNVDKVVVEGVNMMVKNLKSKKRGEKGQKIEFASPIHVSNVMMISPKSDKPTRAGYKITKDNSGKFQKFRIDRKTGEVI